MLNKIVIGTANFINPYGILSKGITVSSAEISYILTEAVKLNILMLDTAIAYGDLAPVVPKNLGQHFKVVTKISVFDDQDSVLKALEKINKFSNVEGILIHDPKNIPKSDKSKLGDFIAYLKEVKKIPKIGVSIYDTNDLDQFNTVVIPDIIQIPLNPFNQAFDNDEFKKFVKEYQVDVHARSLFLQGILLADNLPSDLSPLHSFWLKFQSVIKHYPSRLLALLDWACDFEWVNHWVLGISSFQNFQEIIQSVPKIKNPTKIHFDSVDHPLVDPRNWINIHA